MTRTPAKKMRFRFLATAALCIVCKPLMALEYTASLSVNTNYEDNAELVNDGRSDIETVSALDLSARQDSRKLQLTGSYRLGYIAYENDTNEDRSELTGSSELNASLLPQRLLWSLQHSLTELRSSRSLRDTADNRERRQSVATGPQLQLDVTDVDTLLISAEHAEVLFTRPADSAGSSSSDSTSQSAALNWQHELSAIADLISGYSYRKTERDASTTSSETEIEIEFQNAYLGFNRNLRELQYGLQIGGSRSEVEGGDKNSGLYFQGDLVRQVGSSSLALSASRQQTESSVGLTNTTQLYSAFDDLAALFSGDLGQGNFDNSGVVEITAYELSYYSERYCSRCSYSFTYNFVDSDYEDSSEVDDKEQNIGFQYTLRLNRTLSASITGNRQKTEFGGSNIDQTETRSRLVFTWNPSRELSIFLTGGYEERGGNNSSNYHNSSGGIGFRYTLLESS